MESLDPITLATAKIAKHFHETILNNPWIAHKPFYKQADFLLGQAQESLYGGAAGGGKSDSLLMAALQYVDVPGYAAIVFRKTYGDLSLPGGLIPRSHEWLTGTAAKWNQTDKRWTFPSGATLSFGYLDGERDKWRYGSSEFQFIGFDELTHFGEAEYTFLFTRNRRITSLNVPLRVWSASNPGGPGHDWVRKRFILDGEKNGRSFVPARLQDNKGIDQETYIRSLGVLDDITKQQMLDGNWDANDNGLLSYDVIRSCEPQEGEESPLWPDGRPPIIPTGGQPPELYIGIDIGRTKDLTAIWTWEKIVAADICLCREIYTMQGASYREQKDAIRSRLSRRGVVRCPIDKGAIGNQLAEELEREYRGIVEGVQLSPGVQGRLATRFKTAFLERKVRIPDDPQIRDDFRLVRKTRNVGGVDHVETLRSNVGHADRFWAAALGYDAAMIHRAQPQVSLPSSYRPGTLPRHGQLPHLPPKGAIR